MGPSDDLQISAGVVARASFRGGATGEVLSSDETLGVDNLSCSFSGFCRWGGARSLRWLHGGDDNGEVEIIDEILENFANKEKSQFGTNAHRVDSNRIIYWHGREYRLVGLFQPCNRDIAIVLWVLPSRRFSSEVRAKLRNGIVAYG